MPEAFLCESIRTPIGKFGGSLSTIRPDDLAAYVLSALIEGIPNFEVNAIDEVFLGCANQAGEDNRNVARMAALLSGLPESIPGITLNRLCASGAEAVGTAARAIRAGDIQIAIAGGVENMTRAPLVMAKADKAWSRATQLEDTTIGWRFINDKMRDLYGCASMPETAEAVASRYDVSRDDQDAFAFQSQQRTAAAQDTGYFAEEIISIDISNRKQTAQFSIDEHPRGNTTLEALNKLRPIVKTDGSVTAGNASGVNDGAAAMFVASKQAAEQYGLKPVARILGMASAGVEPNIMGIGPVPASQKLLQQLNLSIDQFDLIEINEAFAAQVIASLRELRIDPFSPKVNPHGGAISLGHPLGMSGARLMMTAAHGLKTIDGRLALITMCVGVGQGLALAIERV